MTRFIIILPIPILPVYQPWASQFVLGNTILYIDLENNRIWYDSGRQSCDNRIVIHLYCVTFAIINTRWFIISGYLIYVQHFFYQLYSINGFVKGSITTIGCCFIVEQTYWDLLKILNIQSTFVISHYLLYYYALYHIFFEGFQY